MATCKYYGFPDIFITITCNPKWPEVVRYLTRHGLKQEDRPDICCRVFKMKLDRLMEQVTKEKTFGVINSDIDRFISAKIPDKELDKYLYEVVSDVIIHGPCGIHNRGSAGMNNGKCTKFFPKPFMENTVVDDAGYPIYKRRKNGRFVHKKGLISRSVKYLFKYITKGPDYIRANVGEEDNQNEIKKFYNCRYISACEAAWRILAFPICYRTTPVEKLPFHLPGQELVVYNEDDPIADVMKRSARRSKLLALMECNKKHPEGRSLTYAEFSNIFVWVHSKKIWQPRSKRRKSFAVGRITYVPPSIGSAYYLRVLLNTVPGATSFDFLKMVKGKLYKEFKDACFALGLLDDDKEYILAIKEAMPLDLWVATKDILCEDILYLQRNRTNNHGLMLSEDQITNLCLAEIEMIMRSNGSSLSTIVNMPKPDQSVIDNN
ncbi:PREDICTED: uncharacterized protein LOC104715381 [Camelina sativa]|uniref:Uncharacterized protein LOC104715381 n=1 Tax=Camelina sativa TaxID=90675 RepID=A0ABM0TTF5_CAMSA|nr:PREDICTED: uncharacterized protein LOC104715381 [Camelina sativa]